MKNIKYTPEELEKIKKRKEAEVLRKNARDMHLHEQKMAHLRGKYTAMSGKSVDLRWNSETLRAKISEL